MVTTIILRYNLYMTISRVLRNKDLKSDDSLHCSGDLKVS